MLALMDYHYSRNNVSMNFRKQNTNQPVEKNRKNYNDKEKEKKKCRIWIFCGDKLFQKRNVYTVFFRAVGICSEYKLQNEQKQLKKTHTNKRGQN